MSLGTPAHARNLQTNVNQNRYFFATQEAGEQELFLSTLSGVGPNGNISSLAVGISGPAGNAVVISEGPSYIASEFVSADQGAIFGAGSTYWTGSTIASTISGVSISSDRSPGTGIACIESYRSNGNTGGFEFLSRGVNSELLSTGMDSYFTSIGRQGATTVIGATGTLATNSILTNIQAAPRADLSGGAQTILYPAPMTNVEFGAGGPNNVVPITGVQTNMFSVPLTGLNPNTQTLLNIDFANALSSGANNLVSYRVGFSTATAYTNVKQTVTVGAGNWTPSGIPSAATPISWTNICCMLDSDGINPDGTANLYIDAQLTNPSAPADQIFIKKGLVTEPTRNAIVWRSI